MHLLFLTLKIEVINKFLIRSCVITPFMSDFLVNLSVHVFLLVVCRELILFSRHVSTWCAIRF